MTYYEGKVCADETCRSCLVTISAPQKLSLVDSSMHRGICGMVICSRKANSYFVRSAWCVAIGSVCRNRKEAKIGDERRRG